MATEYRIIKQGSDFIVQRKFLWWWSTIRHLLSGSVPGGLPASSITRFSSIEEARAFVEDMRPKKSTPIEVVETRLIW